MDLCGEYSAPGKRISTTAVASCRLRCDTPLVERSVTWTCEGPSAKNWIRSSCIAAILAELICHILAVALSPSTTYTMAAPASVGTAVGGLVGRRVGAKEGIGLGAPVGVNVGKAVVGCSAVGHTQS